MEEQRFEPVKVCDFPQVGLDCYYIVSRSQHAFSTIKIIIILQQLKLHTPLHLVQATMVQLKTTS